MRIDVELVPLEEAYFRVFAGRVVPSYAAAKVSAGEWPASVSLDLARSEFRRRLPHGVATAGQLLLRIQTLPDKRQVGDIWLEYRSEAGRQICAVLDLFIDPMERRRGYARAALSIAEAMGRNAGAEEVRLTVLGENEPARALYAAAGYHLLNARLAKPLGQG